MPPLLEVPSLIDALLLRACQLSPCRMLCRHGVARSTLAGGRGIWGRKRELKRDSERLVLGHPRTRTAQQPTAHQLIVIPPSSRHHVAGSPPSDAGDRDAHPLPLRQPPPPPGAAAAAGGALPEDGSTREHWCLDLLLSFHRFVYVGIFFSINVGVHQSMPGQGNARKRQFKNPSSRFTCLCPPS